MKSEIFTEGNEGNEGTEMKEIFYRREQRQQRMNQRITVFAIYAILYEAIIWGLFGWAVFVQGRSGWWIVVAIICSGSQLKPKHFGITEPTKETK